jgi:hypothetical protein
MNEIITFGQGYKLTPQIKVFITSAKKVADTVTVISSALSEDLIDYLKSNNVQIIDSHEIANKYNVIKTLSPYTLKMIYFYLYLKHYTNSNNVYLCDFTDIYFQKNPFDLIVNDKPYVTSENGLVESCQTNSTWINVCYNYDVFGLLSKKEILNGGNIFGNKEKVTDLLKELCLDMTQIISRIGNYQNIDQASLIKTVYFDEFRYNILNKYEIFNLANHRNSKVELKKKTIHINNTCSTVIHQYDAIKTLEQYLLDTYGQ